MSLLKKEISIEKGVPAKIYILTYGVPRSKYEVSKILYNDPNRRNVKEIITELAKANYLVPVDIENKKDPYWISNTEPILNRIQKEKQKRGITLSNEELERINDIISSKTFREFIENVRSKKFRKKKVNGFEAIMTFLDFLLIFLELHRDKDKKGRSIHDEELEKDKATYLKAFERELKNMKSMPPWTKKFVSSWENLFYDAENQEKISNEFIQRIKGISERGRIMLKAMEDAKIIYNVFKEVDEKYGIDD